MRYGAKVDEQHGPIRFTVIGTPQPKGSTRAFMRPGGRFPIVTSDNPKAKAWQKVVGLGAMAARGAGVTPADGPIELEVAFYLQRPQRLARKATPPHLSRPDTDKLTRAIGDAITGIYWKDDGQIVRIVASKAYAAAGEQPRATITVRPLAAAGKMFWVGPV